MAVTSCSDFSLAASSDDLPIFTDSDFTRVAIPRDKSDCGTLQVGRALALIHFPPVTFMDVERPAKSAIDGDLNLKVARSIGPRLKFYDLNT